MTNWEINIASTEIMGTLSVGSYLICPFRVIPTFSMLDDSNLQILQIGDLQGIFTNSMMPFHNLGPMLVHCLSRVKNRIAE